MMNPLKAYSGIKVAKNRTFSDILIAAPRVRLFYGLALLGNKIITHKKAPQKTVLFCVLF